ncbi:beta-ketoacyl synthase N-terminal-like domain-containing protein [Lolliginicoccus levis]|uniref:beta-ketoacyl synthase N-terminal-like domain-containing protein n=1 Tax=Lolliginicoccus levis TaxID=2919542 RepID=UPI002420026D|nr:beta-ketoacyl synthase N-terminal-like domain-containing protein [Lolliginicoccus levis]
MMAPVFTGLGVVAPTGIGAKQFRQHTLGAERAIGPVTRFDARNYPVRVAGEVDGFAGEDHLSRRLLPQTDRMTQMALTAADEALAESGLDADTVDPFDIGVVTASTAGGFEFGQNELAKLWRDGSKHVSAYQSFAWFYAVNSGQISIRHGLKGPSGVIVSDQAGGLDALGQARRQVRNGTVAVVAGGMDATVCPWAWVALMMTGELSSATDPDLAYRPFSSAATGWVPGEGGAMLVLEDAEHARARHAPVRGRLSGYAATFDPRPGSSRGPNLAAAVIAALADAGLGPGDIGFVVADAYGTTERDQMEADVLRDVLGAVPVVVSKTGTGRLLSGGAPVDVVVALQSFGDGLLPPAPGLDGTDALGLDVVVGTPRSHDAEHALVLARGIGGFNSCAVVSR